MKPGFTSDIGELKAIARNLAEDVVNETYSLNEAINEVLPFEWNLDRAEQDYVVACMAAEITKLIGAQEVVA